MSRVGKETARHRVFGLKSSYFIAGVAVLVAVAFGAAWILICLANWDRGLKPNEWGDLFAGIAAPLAFLWLVLTFLQQGGQIESSLKDSTDATNRLIRTERAYVTGGGDFENRLGTEYFRLDVENHGKSPAFMTSYDLQFAKLADLRNEHPHIRDVCENRYRHIDGLSPLGARKVVRTSVSNPPGCDVVFGAVWYEDIFGDAHYSRFILRIATVRDIPNEGLTRLDIEGVSPRYWERDKDAR